MRTPDIARQRPASDRFMYSQRHWAPPPHGLSQPIRSLYSRVSSVGTGGKAPCATRVTGLLGFGEQMEPPFSITRQHSEIRISLGGQIQAQLYHRQQRPGGFRKVIALHPLIQRGSTDPQPLSHHLAHGQTRDG